MNGHFTIKAKMPSLNEVIGKNRSNKYAAASQKRQVEDIVQMSILAGDVPVFTEAVTIFMVFTERTKKRDVDNIQSSQKFILDALVRSGHLPNDTQRWVRQIYHTVVHGATDQVDVYLTTDQYTIEKGESKWHLSLKE